MPRYRGGRLAARGLQTHSPVPTPTRTPPPELAAPSAPISPGSEAPALPPTHPPRAPGRESNALHLAPGPKPRSTTAHPSQLTFPSETPKEVLSQVFGKVRSQFQHEPPKSSLLLSPAAHLRCPGTPARPHPQVERDALERCCPRLVRGPLGEASERRGRDGRCRATRPQVSVRGGARAIEGRRGKRYVGQGSPGLGGEAAEGREERTSRGVKPRRVADWARGRSGADPQAGGVPRGRAAGNPTFCGKQPEPRTQKLRLSGLHGARVASHLESRRRKGRNSVTQIPRASTGLHTAAAMFEKQRAEAFRMPRNCHSGPAPPLRPRALRLPQPRTLTTFCRVRGARPGALPKLPRPVANSELCKPGQELGSFPRPLPPTPPTPPQSALPPKKKKSGSPCTQDRGGPPTGSPGCASVSSKGNSLPLAINCDSRPPPTWPRTEKAGASLETRANSMSKEKAVR